MLFEKHFDSIKNHHLETYLLIFEAISPLYPFLLNLNLPDKIESPQKLT